MRGIYDHISLHTCIKFPRKKKEKILISTTEMTTRYACDIRTHKHAEEMYKAWKSSQGHSDLSI